MLSRREFARLGALGMAAQVVPGALGQQEQQRKIGYCVIGLGRIAGHFMPAVRASANSKITGLVSGHRDKALRLAAEYGVPESSVYSYEDMDLMRENKAIDAVYVALPNSMHAEYTVRSAKAGKHVLCEKPMAISVSECEQMIAACKAANVKLMIAYRCHYDTAHLRAIKLLRDGAVGKIGVIQSAFGGSNPPGEWRLTKKLGGGGSLLDLGIYCLNATRYLTGEEPVKFAGYTSTTDHDGRFNEVDENVAWTAEFPSGVIASCASSYGVSMPSYFRVSGTNGWLEMTSAFNYDGMRLTGNFGGKQIDEPSKDRDPIDFTRQADHLAECIWKNETPRTPGEEGLRDMRYIKAIYHSAGVEMG